MVLSHYDLGTIESITEFTRGSRFSPKVGIVCEVGKFLLKKRDRARGGAERIKFIHEVQAHLAAKEFPLPRLVAPRHPKLGGGGDTVLQWSDGHYELFEFVAGHSYSGEGEETRDAGRTLARFHEALADFPARDEPVLNGYHDALAVQTALNAIPKQVGSHGSAAGRDAEVLGLTSFLFEAYTEAAEAVASCGYGQWPACMTHSDWHPGNLLFKRGRVLSVIDYDCAKWGKAVCDVANGALQFSMIGGSDPANWPDHLDQRRAADFLSGYREVLDLGESQLRVIPHLMIEALIAEAVLPIAATGSFGPFPGLRFLAMVRRKVAWIVGHLGALQEAA